MCKQKDKNVKNFTSDPEKKTKFLKFHKMYDQGFSLDHSLYT